MQILVCDKRVEYRDGMGDCFCCEVCVVREDGVVIEEQGICEPLALENVDEAYCRRRIQQAIKRLRGRWEKNLDPDHTTDFDLEEV